VETAAMADDPEIDQDPMKYIYPITSEQWNAKGQDGKYINHRHQILLDEGYDGDHSFEFRYACRGDYRDGDLINDTSEPTGEVDGNGDPITEDTLQFDINRKTWEAFYEWIITADKAQFQAEAKQWFVPSAIEFFYAFTHYYTMMDNRAKNTFWHWGKRYISTNDANGVNYTAANTAAETAQAAYDEAASNLAAIEEV
jgi:hypothetical protein